MEDRKEFLKQPTPIIQKYEENPNRPGTYDLVNTLDVLKINYFKLSIPRIKRFKQQGAIIMCEAWDKGEKTLFTGLRRLIGSENVLYGDHKRKGRKKSFFCLVGSGITYEMHYFTGFCPRSNKDQSKFLYIYFMNQFIEVR